MMNHTIAWLIKNGFEVLYTSDSSMLSCSIITISVDKYDLVFECDRLHMELTKLGVKFKYEGDDDDLYISGFYNPSTDLSTITINGLSDKHIDIALAVS